MAYKTIASMIAQKHDKKKMPPKKKQTSRQGASPSESCCVCCQSVTVGIDEALFCTGSCQKWLHRYCASVSAQRYQFLAENNTPFICPNCRCERQEEHISELKNTVALLKTEITELRESIMNLRMTTQDAPANLPNMSYAAAAAG